MAEPKPRDQVEQILADAGLMRAGYAVCQMERLPDDQGWRVRIVSPEIVNVFDTGTVTVQGKRPTDVAELLGARRG